MTTIFQKFCNIPLRGGLTSLLFTVVSPILSYGGFMSAFHNRKSLWSHSISILSIGSFMYRVFEYHPTINFQWMDDLAIIQICCVYVSLGEQYKHFYKLITTCYLCAFLELYVSRTTYRTKRCIYAMCYPLLLYELYNTQKKVWIILWCVSILVYVGELHEKYVYNKTISNIIWHGIQSACLGLGYKSRVYKNKTFQNDF